jgi:GH43 family beta-xylosidase
MTYQNPVHPRSCPDPFVLKHLNEYWCYCTGFWHDGRCFGVLHSRDLVHWHELGGALEPLDLDATCYWAPEVVYDNGVFRLYYSVGNEKRMQIRVAEATHPAGPFIDSGLRLTFEDFAIDAHAFIDDNGRRWLFYATDFLDYQQIGTGTVCDELLDPYTLRGNSQPVTRARYDWQVYDPQRKEKGNVRWYTVEGSFVLKHKGLYYQMFSSGNWQHESYGVSYAISDSVNRGEEWIQHADGVHILPILRTIPGKVIGPGHNSVVRGPDNQQLFCVYHRWARETDSRVLAIDPLDWAGERMLVVGPSTTPQPRPTTPLFADFFDQAGEPDEHWRCSGGRWRVLDGLLQQETGSGEAEALCQVRSPYFVAEVSIRMNIAQTSEGAAGVKLLSDAETILFFSLLPQAGQAVIAAPSAGTWSHQNFQLPANFDFSVFHLVRVEVNGARVQLCLDGQVLQWASRLSSQPLSVALMTREAAADFAGFALTGGWQDWFTEAETDPVMLGWITTASDDRWRISNQQLQFIGPAGEPSVLTKGPVPADYELVINARLIRDSRPNECYGFYPALSAEDFSPLLTVKSGQDGWALETTTQMGKQIFPLPASFDPFVFQQFRFRKEKRLLTIQHEANFIGQIEVPHEARLVGLYGYCEIAAFDLVRVTALPPSDQLISKEKAT